MTGHAFWCERTRVDSPDVECTCADDCVRIACRCGHAVQDHLGNGGFCRYCRPHQPGTTCLEYDAVRTAVNY